MCRHLATALTSSQSTLYYGQCYSGLAAIVLENSRHLFAHSMHLTDQSVALQALPARAARRTRGRQCITCAVCEVTGGYFPHTVTHCHILQRQIFDVLLFQAIDEVRVLSLITANVFEEDVSLRRTIVHTQASAAEAESNVQKTQIPQVGAQKSA